MIDCKEQVLIPGLIDCHGLVSMDPTQDHWPVHLNEDEAEQALLP